MTLDLSAIGKSTEPFEFKYTWKDVVLYALGIGAKKEELDHLYEARGPKVYPTFAMVPMLPALGAALELTGGSLESILHGAETIRMHAPFPPSGAARTVATLERIYDLKRMALAQVTTRTEIDGKLIFETEADIIYRGEGGFGGKARPKEKIPTPPHHTEPTWTHQETISPEQALVYRLSGDENPLHIDPDVAQSVGFPSPILHGLCTYGFVCRAVAKNACGGDASRIKTFGAQFRKPVWPGETLTTKGWDLGDGTVAVRAYTTDEKPVVSNCWAELSD